ncbi:MAG TPA: 3-dehydroquinate synthase family protein, partial [Spirochaetia bacterium]|nr:3-dehydroquinate synthase family protein [Spirochaetia bacterium]
MESRIFHFGHSSSNVMLEQVFRLPSPGDGASCLYIYDRNTFPLFGKTDSDPVILPPGERGKGWRAVEAIHRAALDRGLGRDSIFLGVGGGIVCDITAFASSIYMRGNRLVLVPTTLLAMVDAAIGGKTGVNFRGYKNFIGSFYPAEGIHIFTQVLESLPEKEYRSGLAEVIKTALLGDAELFRILAEQMPGINARDRSILQDVIMRCVAVKGRIVEGDLREGGERAILNLGHTFGHALESVQRFRGLTHGEAVGWGIARAMELGVKLSLTDPGYADSVKDLLVRYGFRLTVTGLDPFSIVKAMRMDKKRIKG